MPDYKSMYYALAAQVANAIDLLVQAQQEGEESALKEGCALSLLPKSDESEKAKENRRV